MKTTLPLVLAVVAQDDAAADWPTFDVRDVEGFAVHVNEAALAQHPEDMAAALAHLRWQLYATSLVLPAESLAKVREVPLWAEHATPTACMSFHPGRQWLLDRDSYRGIALTCCLLKLQEHVLVNRVGLYMEHAAFFHPGQGGY